MTKPNNSQNAEILKLSVTSVVDFAAREGDLFNEDFVGPDAREGQLGHRQVQAMRTPPWQTEQAFSAEFSARGQAVLLSGRVDCCNLDQQPAIIEELKTCYGPGHLQAPQRKALHWAQLKVYAALYFRSGAKASTVKLCLSYYDLLSRQIAQEEQVITAQAALAFCQQLLEVYCHWRQLWQNKVASARHYAKNLAFPFSRYRPGQRQAAISVFRQLRDGKPLLIEAPTGTGKTLSVLFPALKAWGEQHLQQLLYLTPKGSAQLNALEALNRIDAATQLYGLVVQAKERACPCLAENALERASCDAGNGLCSRTLGFYDRLPAAREASLQTPLLDSETLQSLATRHHLCPFALAMHLLPWMNLVIADVNYFFDPLVRLSCFEQGGDARALLIDEVHNLPERARAMYSAELDSELSERVLQALPSSLAQVKKPLLRLVAALKSLQIQDLQTQSLPGNVQASLQALLRALQQSGDNGFAGGLVGHLIADYRHWVKQVYRFIAIANLQSNAHYYDLQVFGEHRNLSLRCLDAAAFLQQHYASARASIGFSATLAPFEFSLRRLGLPAETATMGLAAHFPPQNQLTLCCRFLSTQWQMREQTLASLVQLIAKVCLAKAGRYLIFFPSYAYLQMTLQAFRGCYPDQEILVQSDSDNEIDRRNFIKAFRDGQHATRLGFAVLGGVFAEGVDYAGQALIGTVIIGTGMPQPSEERQRMASYYRQQGLNAYQHAYQLPGFIRLRQTAGRVIRSETDRGVVVFVEPRLLRNDFRGLIPTHWQLQACDSLQEMESKLQQFWAKQR